MLFPIRDERKARKLGLCQPCSGFKRKRYELIIRVKLVQKGLSRLRSLTPVGDEGGDVIIPRWTYDLGCVETLGLLLLD